MSQSFNFPPVDVAFPGALDVNVISSVLPTGASTSAKQDTGNASLASIDSKVSTAAKQDSQTALLTAIDADTSNIAVSVAGLLTDTQLRASPVPISGTVAVNNFPATQPVSGTVAATQSGTWNITNVSGTVSLPTGAATETTLSAINAKLPAQGQATMAASQPVVIASNQTAIPVTTSVTDTTASGTITAINQNVAATSLNGAATAIFQVTGTYTGALTAQVTQDGTNWVAISVMNMNTGALSATVASATQGVFQAEIAGTANFRVIALAAVTGTATVTLRITRAQGLMGLDGPIPAGTNIIGALSANQSVNVAQIGGVAPTMGNGVSGTGTQRVTIASDSTGVIGVTSAGKTLRNSVRNDYTSVSVTTGAWVQLIASTSGIVNLVEIFDSSGQTMELGVGAAASEVRLCIIFPGGNGQIPINIATAQRISVRAISGNASVGEIDVNLYS